MKRRRPRRRSPLPFLLLAVAVVGCAFAVAVAAVVPMEADSPGGQDQALPTPTLEEAERDKLDALRRQRRHLRPPHTYRTKRKLKCWRA